MGELSKLLLGAEPRPGAATRTGYRRPRRAAARVRPGDRVRLRRAATTTSPLDEHTFAVVQAAADAGVLAGGAARDAPPRPRQADRRLARARRAPPLLREARLRRHTGTTRSARTSPRRHCNGSGIRTRCGSESCGSCAATCSSPAKGDALERAAAASCAGTATSSRSTSSTTSSPICSASAARTASRRRPRRSSALARFREVVRARALRARTGSRDLAVDGTDLIELGFEPGPQLGRILARPARRGRRRAGAEHAASQLLARARSYGC